MNKELKDFLEEFTDNFSELCIEAFKVRFLLNFDKTLYDDAKKEAQELIEKKISKKFKEEIE